MKNNNCPVILNAIQGLSVAFKEASYLLTENGIKFAGCEHCVRPVSTTFFFQYFSIPNNSKTILF